MEGLDTVAEGGFVGGAEVGEAVVAAEVLGGAGVAATDEGVGGGAAERS